MAGSERRYRIQVTPAAARQLRKLDPQVARRVQGAIELLAVDPRPPASRALRGRPGYRVRIGDYRLLYTVQDDVLLVVLIRLGHRRDVYER
ncbi:type II toxin-antitoxin system RelE/ParE family toxin [Nocardioides sp.]|uniref:type II toxin-antitoxin system RelE family toxin n=1 Tax=Nocardioides sp. TaxID=35761 RepID=UPI0025DF2667|nr:type II toxin-antitoxin system RelE/ParE family toxin [Nocardioides sp.]